MTAFELLPFESVGPFRFGSRLDELERVVGRSLRLRPNGRGSADMDLGEVFLGVEETNGSLYQVAVARNSTMLYRDIDLLNDRHVLSKLFELDRSARQGVGIYVFPALGIALSDIHSDQHSDHVATAFARSSWAATIASMAQVDLRNVTLSRLGE